MSHQTALLAILYTGYAVYRFVDAFGGQILAWSFRQYTRKLVKTCRGMSVKQRIDRLKTCQWPVHIIKAYGSLSGIAETEVIYRMDIETRNALLIPMLQVLINACRASPPNDTHALWQMAVVLHYCRMNDTSFM